MKSTKLSDLSALGQSPWYDNIDRRLIENGELQSLFDLGVTGVTSNPSIFEKAVKGSEIYDDLIKVHARNGDSTLDIYDAITVQDVQSAADMLSDTYRNSEGQDGYVSLEVLPDLAYETDKTVENAKDLWAKVSRPNLMIKVPGTAAGYPAIRELTKAGINVNVTLLFSIDHYRHSANAYIAGLADRQAAGEDISGLFSVASVFISRVDTMVDEQLTALGNSALQGEVAVANAKAIYQEFKTLFFDSDFDKLQALGGNRQKVLWGSTSTKNPAYRDVKYVEELIGEDTINTMPHKTLEAFLDHGQVAPTVEADWKQAAACLDEVASFGIDLNRICDEIQAKGVTDFVTAFDGLIAAIEEKK